MISQCYRIPWNTNAYAEKNTLTGTSDGFSGLFFVSRQTLTRTRILFGSATGFRNRSRIPIRLFQANTLIPQPDTIW